MLDLAHALGDAADRLDGAGGRALHRKNLAGYFLSRIGGLHGQRFHFRSHDREAPARLAGARGFDRGVERKQVGLAGNVADQLDHVADLLRRGGKRLDRAVRGVGLGHGETNDLVGLIEPAADLGDRARHLVGGVGRGADILRRLVRSLDRAFGALRGLAGDAGECGRSRLHGVGAFAHALEQGIHALAERGDRALDGRAAAFLRGHRVALLLELMLFGDVLVGRDPAAAGHRQVHRMDVATVAGGDAPGRHFAGPDAVHDVAVIFFRIAG